MAHDDHDLDDELKSYVDHIAEEKRRGGMSEADARRAALVEVGGVPQVKEAVRDLRPGVLLETFIQDALYAVRTLWRAPAFSFVVIVTLAVAIGAGTAIFSMVTGVMIRRLPIGAGNSLVHLTQPSARSDNEGYSVLEVQSLNHDMRSVSAVAEYHSMMFQLFGYGEPLRVQTGVVSDRFFDMIGVRPLLGRTFQPGEEAVGAPPVVVLSYRFWMSQFHGDSNVIGASFTMNDKIHHVVGVLPPLPGYPDDNDIWMPAGACPFRSAPMMMGDRGMRMVEAFAVLKPGVKLATAKSELASLSARYHADYPAAYANPQRLTMTMQPSIDEMTARAKPIFLLLLVTAAFLLVAAVANAANLSLSRHVRRGRELALRVALGAGAWRLYRQLALESLVLALSGGALGAMLAFAGVGLLRTVATRLTPRAAEIQIDASVLLFALGLCVVVALVIAAAPFLHALGRRNPAEALRQGNAAATMNRGEQRLRTVLVTAQVAIASLMLVGAGLLGRSLLELERVDAGLDVRNVATARLSLNFTKYSTPELRHQVALNLMDRMQSLPGVTAMALASDLPLNSGQPQNVGFMIDGAAPEGGVGPHSDVTAVSPEYFRAVGIPLVKGRAFTLADRDTAGLVAIVSARLAKRYWQGRDPVGTRISADSGKHWATIVGVAGDVHQNRLDGDVTDEVYIPLLTSGASDLRVFLRTTGALPPVIKAMRDAVHEVDPTQPVSSVQSLEEVRGAQLAEPRLTVTLLSVFAAIALLLTATGLGGVIAYGVTQRLPEIAIRVALGASARQVLALVLREGLFVVAVGLVIGLALAAWASRLVSGLLYHVPSTDVLTYVVVTLVIGGAAGLACFLPSRRALGADPAQVFRA